EQLFNALDINERKPLLLWGNHYAGKSTSLHRVLREKQYHHGVLRLICAENTDRATTKLLSFVGAKNELEAMETLRQAAAEMKRLPVIVLEVPREITSSEVVQSCSTFAKKFGYDLRLAKVLVVVSATAHALGFSADQRELRFYLPPLSEQECQQQE
ncbi:unnamed protein product, partial [Symbiodinium pilosum]